MNTVDVTLPRLNGKRDREDTFSTPDSGQVGHVPRLRAGGDDELGGGHWPDVPVVQVDLHLTDGAVLQ